MPAVLLHVAESVRANARARVNGHAVADAGAAVYGNARIQLAVGADLDGRADRAMRADHRAVAYARALSDDRVRPNGNALAEANAVADDGRRVNAFIRARRAMKPRQQR